MSFRPHLFPLLGAPDHDYPSLEDILAFGPDLTLATRSAPHRVFRHLLRSSTHATSSRIRRISPPHRTHTHRHHDTKPRIFPTASSALFRNQLCQPADPYQCSMTMSNIARPPQHVQATAPNSFTGARRSGLRLSVPQIPSFLPTARRRIRAALYLYDYLFLVSVCSWCLRRS